MEGISLGMDLEISFQLFESDIKSLWSPVYSACIDYNRLAIWTYIGFVSSIVFALFLFCLPRVQVHISNSY